MVFKAEALMIGCVLKFETPPAKVYVCRSGHFLFPSFIIVSSTAMRASTNHKWICIFDAILYCHMNL